MPSHVLLLAVVLIVLAGLAPALAAEADAPAPAPAAVPGSIIGPHFIDARRNVRTCDAIKGHRVTADRPCTATAWFTYD